MYLCKIENFANGEINERSFSNPHPWFTDVSNTFYPRTVSAFGYCHCLHLSVCLSVCPSICVRRPRAAVAPVKYKCDSSYIRCTCARSKILLMEKLTNGALVTPTPDLLMCLTLFTRGQFRPLGIVIACTCLSVCLSVRPYVCVDHELVHAKTCHIVKLEPPNSDKRCKAPSADVCPLDVIDQRVPVKQETGTISHLTFRIQHFPFRIQHLHFAFRISHLAIRMILRAFPCHVELKKTSWLYR